MPKKLFIVLCALWTASVVFGADKAAAPAASPVLQSDTVVWAGLDYSLVRMYGTMDFREPETIFPQYLEAWNGLFIQELVVHKSERLSKATHKKVVTDTEGMSKRNALAKPEQIIRQDGKFTDETHIKDEDIAAAVRSYKLSNTSGLGLVFIVDRLVKTEQKGAVYLVYFDVATREVLAKQRVVVKAGGFGFRNYWFRVVKDALPHLKKLA
jgi:hypothetical protein